MLWSDFFRARRERQEQLEIPWQISESSSCLLNDVFDWNIRHDKSRILEVHRVAVTAPHSTPLLPRVTYICEGFKGRHYHIERESKFVS